MKRLEAKRRMKSLIMFFPNLVALCVRLLRDSRVPKTEKALLAGAIVYAILPLDFIPDMIPFVGQMDDAYLIALTLLRLIDRTDEAIVREHWRGGGDIIQLTESLAKFAPLVLPKRIQRVLSVRVAKAADAGRDALPNKAQAAALKFVEVPDGE
ncbi:MAG: YkvA family protein [Pyrinomonadaceae bacterium]